MILEYRFSIKKEEITKGKMLKKTKTVILILTALLDAVFIMARNTAPRYVLLQPGDR